MNTTILTVLAAATFALAGCAVDPSASEDPGTTDQAIATGDRANQAFNEKVSIGGRAGVVIADDPGMRIGEFDKTPSIAQHAAYDVSLAELKAVAAVPHSATDGTDVETRQAANCGVGGCP